MKSLPSVIRQSAFGEKSTVATGKMRTAKFSALALALIPCLSAEADVLVNYGPSSEYVSADASFSRTATQSGSVGNYVYLNAFSDTVALSPSAGYSGPTFFGGYEYTVTGGTFTPLFNRQQIRNAPLSAVGNMDDMIYLQDYAGDGTVGATMGLHAAFVFNLPLTSSLDNLTANVTSNSSNVSFRNGATWRWMVCVNDTYYVSEDTFIYTGYQPLNETQSLSDPSSQTWAVYDPAADLDFDQNTAVYTTIDTGHVTAVGLYLENDAWVGESSDQAFNFYIETFAANGTAIPESSSSSLLLLSAALLLTVGCRLKRRHCGKLSADSLRLP